MAALGARADPPARRRRRAFRIDRLLAARPRRPGAAARATSSTSAASSSSPGEIRIRVTNPQRQSSTIAHRHRRRRDRALPARRPGELGRLRSSTIVVPFQWVEDDPYTVGVTSSSGIETSFDVPAAVEARGASPRGFLGYALIGLLVGVVPVALGLGWLPSLRRADARWLAAFMALTAGLLSFLAFDALARGSRSSRRHCPSGFPGHRPDPARRRRQLPRPDVRRATRSASARRERSAPLEGAALAALIAAGIGLHNLGEGLAIGSSIALGELALGTFLIVGFMVHNITEGLGIATPIASGGRVSFAAARSAGARRRRARDRRRLDRRLPHERPARRPLLRARRRSRAPGRGRGRPLRRAPRPRRALAPATSSAATSPGSSSCTQPGSWSA